MYRPFLQSKSLNHPSCVFPTIKADNKNVFILSIGVKTNEMHLSSGAIVYYTSGQSQTRSKHHSGVNNYKPIFSQIGTYELLGTIL